MTKILDPTDAAIMYYTEAALLLVEANTALRRAMIVLSIPTQLGVQPSVDMLTLTSKNKNLCDEIDALFVPILDAGIES